MQSSGTSTPAGDSPGPGRAFLRKTDFTPEIAPPRLRRTTYPAGQSPLVLPGLTRASSSFTITSNHQNILPLWPAAPPPGQPVVFFVRCPALVRSVFLLSGGMVCPRGDRPALRHGGPLCRTRDREDESSLSASLSPLARQPSPMPGHGAPASREGLTSCTARPADTSGARQALAGPMLPPRSSRTFRASVPVQPEGGDAFRRSSLSLAFSSFFLIAETPRAVRLLRGNPAAQKKTPTGMETGGRQESLYGCGARDQNSL